MTEHEVQRGNAWSRAINVTQTINGVTSAYDLTDKTLIFTLKKSSDLSLNDDQALIKKTITVHSHADAGISLLDLTAIETNIAFGTYKCDIRIKEIDANTSKFFLKIVDIVTTRKV